jgi:ribosomal protein L24E
MLTINDKQKTKTKLDAKPNDVKWLAPRQQRQKKGLVDG